MMKKKILIGICIALLLAAFLLRILFPGAAFVWPWVYLLPGIAFFIAGILWQQKKYVLPVSQVLFAICLTAFLAEIYFQRTLAASQIPGYRIEPPAGYGVHEGKKLQFLTSDIFGGYPNSLTLNKPNLNGLHRACRKMPDGSVKIIFEAEYTMDPFGFRAVPCRTEKPVRKPLFFFGDSFTFGVGVGDPEVYVNRIAAKWKDIGNVYNFAVPGGSPAEFFFFLKQNVIERSGAGKKPGGKAYYLLINDHRYRILGSRVRNLGVFLTWKEKLPINFAYWMKVRLFYESALFNAICSGLQGDLYLRYLKECETILKEKYAVDLTVIVYPDCTPEVLTQLKNSGFKLIYLKDVMPGYEGLHTRKADLRYEIPLDGHPNAETHQLIAEFLLNKELSGKDPADGSAPGKNAR